MSFNIPIAMFGWLPFTLLLFGTLPPKRALVIVYILGWLILPNVRYDLQGLPDYSKTTATSYAVVIATLIFDAGRLMRFRPRWFDLPVVVYTVSPLVSSVLNDLGWYDGISNLLTQFLSYAVPYFIGRLYFETAEDLKQLAVGIFVGGLCYILPCLLEIRISPKIKLWVYGIGGWEFMRYGGYRPQVLLGTGLELGMWMTAASLMGYALWAGRTRSRVMGLPIGAALSALLVTTILCKSTGAILLLIVGIATLWLAGRMKFSLPLILLIAVPPTYALVRSAGWWDGRNAVELVTQTIGADRAQSLQYRLDTEELLLVKAFERPFFGWGGYNRERVYDAAGNCLTITDGHWILDLGVRGLVSLVAWNFMMTLPVLRLLRRSPARTWLEPTIAPVAALSLIGLLYAFDCLSNDMYNPIYLVATGGVHTAAATLVASRRRIELDDDSTATADDLVAEARAQAREAARLEAVGHFGRAVEAHRRVVGAWEALVDRDPDDPAPRRALARAYEAYAQTPALADRPDDAARLRAHALDWWEALLAEQPDDPESRRRCGIARNDLAWTLLNRTDAKAGVHAHAAALAESAVALAPDHDACWNTLATAAYRAGDWRAAIDIIDRATREGHGHPGYDSLVLAMAYHHLGDPTRARRWFDRGDAWWRSHGRGSLDMARLHREAEALLATRERAALPARIS